MSHLYFLPLLLSSTFVLTTGLGFLQGKNFDLLTKGTVEYVRTRKAPDYFLDALKLHQLPGFFRKNTIETYSSPEVCFYCNLVADLLYGERKLGMTRETLIEEIKFFCTHLGIESDRVCAGVVELNVDIYIYIMDNYVDFTSNRFCGTVLQEQGCSTGSDFNWTIGIPAGNSPPRPAPSGSRSDSLKILQLSDIHYDPEYTPGGNAACGEPLCCQRDQGAPTSPEDACGYWSDLRDADAPWQLVEETVRQAKTQDFDYVYFTGDIVVHRVWETSVEKNTDAITRILTYFRDSFDVPVFPIFGNHEPHPVNVWTPSDVDDERFDEKWLLDLAAKSWSELIGQDVSETVLKGGYYSVSPEPGFRVIAVNSNLGNIDNWWVMFEDFDPFNQLQWLADELKKAEDADESVHLLSHLPSGGGDSLIVWHREYARIVERFANTITGHFNGHTHVDEFQVYYNSSDPTQAINVAYNGAAVTPTGYNPSFKYYYVDKETFHLLDSDEWTFNLTLANSQPTQPVDWYRLYSFVDAYGVDSMLPTEVDALLHKMTSDHSLIQAYHKFKYRNGDRYQGCDEGCERSNLCSILVTVYGQSTQCDRFQALYSRA